MAPHHELIEILCEIGEFISQKNGKHHIRKTGKEFLTMPSPIQQLCLFQLYWDLLDWNYFYDRDDDDTLHWINTLQENRLQLLVLLYELKGPIDRDEFCSFMGHQLQFSPTPETTAIITATCLDPLILFGVAEQTQSNPPLISLRDMGRQFCDVIREQQGGGRPTVTKSSAEL